MRDTGSTVGAADDELLELPELQPANNADKAITVNVGLCMAIVTQS